MQRWVNDYRIAERCFQGYRPVLPLKVKPVGEDIWAMKMEKPDADYKATQESKQIINDFKCMSFDPMGGRELKQYVDQEIKIAIGCLTAWNTFKLLMVKVFRRNCNA